LDLPAEILDALSTGHIFEGHTRPLLALSSRPEEQNTLFKEIMFKKLTVREAEAIARRIAYEKARKVGMLDPQTQEMEEALTESLGTRVLIEKRENGGKITIDFFSDEDLKNILGLIKNNQSSPLIQEPKIEDVILAVSSNKQQAENPGEVSQTMDDRSPQEIKQAEDSEDENLYSIKDFSI
jgi:hypothetical protein